MVQLKGWRYYTFVGGIITFMGCAVYPIILHPMLYPEEYKKVQTVNRKGINQEAIQPGNMKVWTDPFERKN